MSRPITAAAARAVTLPAMMRIVTSALAIADAAPKPPCGTTGNVAVDTDEHGYRDPA